MPHTNLAIVLEGQGKYQEAVAEYQQALRQVPTDVGILTLLAQLRCTATDPAFRDYKQALELAQKAMAAKSHPAEAHRALGMSQYRLGDWAAAFDSLQQSIKLRRENDATDWFFLAMTHWQLGDQEQAREWFKKAVAWTQEHKPQEWRLRKYCTEAAALLGEETPAAEPENRKDTPANDSGTNEQ